MVEPPEDKPRIRLGEIIIIVVIVIIVVVVILALVGPVVGNIISDDLLSL